MNKLFFTLMALWLSTLEAHSTAQIPDLIVIGSDTFKLYATPLEEYFRQAGKTDLPEFSGCGSTACWRGYQAVWKVEDNKIYLTAVRSCWPCEGNRPANLQKLFGDEFAGGKVFADWVHGKLSIPYGDRLQYIHMGFASRYEKEKVLDVSNGKITSTKDYINVQHDPTRLNRFTQLDTLFHILNNKIRWARLPKDEDDTWWEDVEITISKEGATRIDIPDYLDKKYLKEVRRVLKPLRWEIVSQEGRPIQETYYIEVEFDFQNRVIRDANSIEDE